jgi:hypothetical protein
MSECDPSTPILIHGTHGVVKTFLSKPVNLPANFSSCLIHIRVLTDIGIRAMAQLVKPCDGSTTVVGVNDVNAFGQGRSWLDPTWGLRSGPETEKTTLLCWDQGAMGLGFYAVGDETKSQLLLFSGPDIFVLIEDYDALPNEVIIRFLGTRENVSSPAFECINKSTEQGFIAPPGYQEHLDYPAGIYIEHIIDIPPGMVLMYSFLKFQLPHTNDCKYFDIVALADMDRKKNLWMECGFKILEARVLSMSAVLLGFRSVLHLPHASRLQKGGFLMHYSLHKQGHISQGKVHIIILILILILIIIIIIITGVLFFLKLLQLYEEFNKRCTMYFSCTIFTTFAADANGFVRLLSTLLRVSQTSGL